MLEKKILVYSADSTIAIIEGIFNYDDYTIKILAKKNYLKSKFFEVHSKVLSQLFAVGQGVSSIDLKTNLLPASEIYKLIIEQSLSNPYCTIQGKYEPKEDEIQRTYRLLIDSNFKDIYFKDNVTEKRILSELKQRSFEDLSDKSFLAFIKSLPKKLDVYQESYFEKLESKQVQERIAVEPIFGGVLTSRGIKNIFL